MAYQLASGVSFKDNGDECILINIESGKIFSLNDTGKMMFSHIMEGQPADTVVDKIVEAYNAPDRARVLKDYEALVTHLLNSQLIEGCVA